MQNQLSETIHWNEDGDAILINDIEELVKSVLSVHYKQSNFLSFSRQLNQYGFQKQRIGKKTYIFKHPYFQKTKKENLINIVSSHKIKSFKIQQQEGDDDNLVNINEQSSLATTIKKLQNQQKIICQQFSEQIELQSQIKQIIIFLKKKIYECDQTIDNYCFIGQLHLVKAMNLIPNDEEHQQEIEFIKQILEQFSNIYMEYIDQSQVSQRSYNLSVRSCTPLPFYQYEQSQQQKPPAGLIDQKNTQLKQNIANYLIWLQQWYQEALQLYGNLK
ncbi:unnamed protein product (macronuclear) [Paramecium tetraurelia]|uniref:HSF-type DNA-binding domain-containing protein n=1 Tax=Paramecium tetraurelia TaxID=5888 RepID=A0E0T0_PARTE|nr:uncharacterized protein GSPATT00022065001 [Paramecium tetraurelia]CAK88897.1 unnamed protein product [Paramecium tetraurelia]|eukprot:XP_001456294.1 hypothetical protein (macronuclear) [Paramecium tetraurelia strain d4-2]